MSRADSPSTKSHRPDLAGNGDSDIFSDPLLGSDSFIDASIYTSGETLEPRESPNQKATPAEPLRGRRLREDGVASATESSSHAPTPANTGSPADSRSRKKKTSNSTVPSERPDWLPPDWVVEDRVRSSGATAGSHDKYYFDPASGRRFRSKVEVMYFLDTGSVRKKRASENPEADAKPSESPGPKKKKSSKKAKSTPVKNTPLNFDFHNVPENVKWVLTNSADGTWSPFTGEVKVPESTKKEWTAAFTSLTVKNGGRIAF